MPDKNGWNKTIETPPPMDVVLEIYSPGCERSFGSFSEDYSGKMEWNQNCAVDGYDYEWEYYFNDPEYWRIPCDLPEIEAKNEI